MPPPATTATTNERQMRFEREYQPSNRIFSKDEQDTLRELISDSQYALKSISDEITAQRAVLPILVAQHKRECSGMQRLRVGLAPHKIVPPEVLSLIFSSGISMRPAPIVHNSSNYPWNITQVCAKWRAIALANPRLWRSMSLTVSYGPWTYPIPSHIHSFMECLSIYASGCGFDNTVAVGRVLALFSGSRKLQSIIVDSWVSISLNDAECLGTFPWSQITDLTLPLGDRGLPTGEFIEIIQHALNVASISPVLSTLESHRGPHGSAKTHSLRNLTIHASRIRGRLDHASVAKFLSTVALLSILSIETVTIYESASKSGED